MPQDPQAEFDHHLLDQIEHSPVGAVPRTPAYQDAVKRLLTSHQVYASADHKDGFVTARSLATSPVFHAENLATFRSGAIADTALEANGKVFDRYVQSLPVALRPKAEAWRLRVIGRPIHHRPKADGTIVHDPLHAVFLVPGAGPHPGIPGNYLYGFVLEMGGTNPAAAWSVQLHDSDDGVVMFDAPSLSLALEKLDEVLASAPFHMRELLALGFRSN